MTFESGQTSEHVDLDPTITRDMEERGHGFATPLVWPEGDQEGVTVGDIINGWIATGNNLADGISVGEGIVRRSIVVDLSDTDTLTRTTEGLRIVRRLQVHLDIENKVERISLTEAIRYSSQDSPIMDVASGRLVEGTQQLTFRVLARHE